VLVALGLVVQAGVEVANEHVRDLRHHVLGVVDLSRA
jgi:hypothetical protein